MPEASRGSRRAPDLVLVGGLAAVAALAFALRAAHLGAHLPTLVAPDEPTVMDRALALLHGHAPSEWDWPQGSMTLLAAAIGAVRVLTPWANGTPWLFGRVLFALVAVAAVVLTGFLGAAASGAATGENAWRRRLTAWIASALVAVSYLSVRASRSIQPDHLQLVAMLGAFLCIVRYDRDSDRDTRWIAAAGLLAGVAAAAKYLGVLVVVPAAVAVLWARAPWRARVRDLAVLAVTTVVGFLALAWGALLEPGAFWSGLKGQFGHQAAGHLGYDADTPGWWFHATRSLPGNWGWVTTVLAALGVALVLWRGDRVQRLLAVFAVGLFAVVGLSKVEFPHYMLPPLPFLAVLAAIAVVTIVLSTGAPAFAVVAVVGLGLALAPTFADDVRLVRASAAPDTRELVDPILARLPGPVWTERYAALPGRGTPVGDFGSRPDAVDCNCFVVLSSYMEDRFRREPERYAAQVANYDRLREQGQRVYVLGPHPRLAYNWDVLPRFGLGKLPLRGDISAVGPTITILDLRS